MELAGMCRHICDTFVYKPGIFMRKIIKFSFVMETYCLKIKDILDQCAVQYM